MNPDKDDEPPGYGARARKGGKKTGIAQYRVGRKQRRVTLGDFRTVDEPEMRG